MKSKLYLIKGGQYYNNSHIPKQSMAELYIIKDSNTNDTDSWDLIDKDNDDRLIGGLYEQLCKGYHDK